MIYLAGDIFDVPGIYPDVGWMGGGFIGKRRGGRVYKKSSDHYQYTDQYKERKGPY